MSFILSLVLFVLASCSRDTIRLIVISSTGDNVESIEGLEYGKCSTENLDIYASFVEDAFEFFAFRFTVANYSSDSILIRSEDFEMSVYDKDADDIVVSLQKIEKDA